MFDINEIKKRIPHRYPFLLLDKVTEVEQNKRVVGVKNVTANEPFFFGHFPHFPVMPGVLIIESMAQLSAFLAVESAGQNNDSSSVTPLFTGIKSAKFRKQVVPGDTLILTVEVLQIRRTTWRLKGEALVDGKLAAEAEIMAMIQGL